VSVSDNGSMTVEELRALLEDLPDDAVVAAGEDDGSSDGFAVVRAVAPVRVQSRDDGFAWWRDRTADALEYAAADTAQRFGDLPLGVVLLRD
jgi:streptogramin lyase